MWSFIRKSIVKITNTNFYKYLLLDIVPYVRFTTYYASFSGKKYHSGYKKLLPGHIVLSIDRKNLAGKMVRFLTKGQFSHASLCVSKDNIWEISEMTHSDYTKSCFFDICKTADRVVILECTDFDIEYTYKMISMCKSFSGAKYDVNFDLGIKSLYCSELVYQSDYERRLKVDLSDIHGLGVKYISPDGLYKAKNVLVIWDSDL